MPNLHFEQVIDAPLDEVFRFHQDPHNLLKITPAGLNLKVTNDVSSTVSKGTEITYRIKWMGVPLNWRTLISAYDPPTGFTDIQLKGPYKKWEHTHRFEPMGDKTRVIDDVLYELPMGFLGELVAGRMIRRQLNNIFAYRSQQLESYFSNPTLPNS